MPPSYGPPQVKQHQLAQISGSPAGLKDKVAMGVVYSLPFYQYLKNKFLPLFRL
jgi:hypothetical protein